MAIRQENLIASFIVQLDRASIARAEKARDGLEGNVEVTVDIDQKGFERQVGGFQRGLGNLSVLGVAAGNVIASAFLGATEAIGGTISESIRLAAEAEQINVAFSTFLGSTEAAKEVIADLEQFSLSTPFEPQQVLAAGQALLAFGEPVDTLTESLGRIGDIASGTGKDFTELSVIYGKARVAGTLFAEDINQLTEAGVPIIQEFAKQLGVTEGEVKKLASEGRIGFEQLQVAFESLTSEGGKFFELTARQATTVGGLQSTLAGAFSSLQKSLGEAILPLAREVLPQLISGLFSLVDSARSVAVPFAQFFVGAFRSIQQVLSPVTEALGRFFGRFTQGQGVLRRFQPVLDFLARVFAFVSVQIGRAIDAFGALTSFLSNQIGGSGIIGRFASFIGEVFSNIPAILNGTIEAFFAFPRAISNAFTRTILQARAFISDLGELLDPRNIARAIFDGFDAFDFSGGNALRNQADQFRSFGSVVGDAFREGFNEINDVGFDIPEIATPEGIERAKKDGEDLGSAVADGVSGKLKEQLPEGSLAALKDALSDVESQLELIANVRVFDGEGVDELRTKIQEIADKREEIELLEGILDRLATGDLGTIDVRLDTIGGVEGADAEAQRIFDEFQESVNEIDKAGLFGLSEEDLATIKDRALEALDAAKELTQGLLQQAIERKDNEIAIQQDRLDEVLAVADRGNAESLQLESERLRRLTEEREKFATAQRRISAIQAAANQALAISSGIAAVAAAFNPATGGNLVTGVLTSIALAAQIAATVASLSSAFSDIPSFYKGTEKVPGPTTQGRLIEVHGEERVLNAADNAPLLKLGVKNKDIPTLVEMGLMASSARIPSGLLAAKQGREMEQLRLDNQRLIKEQRKTNKLLASLRISQNISERGIEQLVSTEAQRRIRRSNLRR